MPCWAKPATDGQGWILRLHETMGRRGIVRLDLARGLRAEKTDLSEGPTTGEAGTDINVAPYELISVRIR